MTANLSLGGIRAGGKRALADALVRIEADQTAGRDDPAIAALLDDAFQCGAGHVVGLTGPPGVGKSTLTRALIAAWRAQGLSVGVIAVDPSSKRSGGALLGDRTRLKTDPSDDELFVRSMAARDRLGGLAGLTIAASVLMRAVFDRVLIETVGVGQSETEIAMVADTVVFCIQPGSGDSLQFMKAGIMEVPHILAVTKADMGPAARRAKADAEGALGLASGGHCGPDARWPVPVMLVSATGGEGIGALVATIERHGTTLASADTAAARRRTQATAWIEAGVRDRFGRDGVSRVYDTNGLAGAPGLLDHTAPFATQARLAAALRGVLEDASP